jgi:hypothetical protein
MASAESASRATASSCAIPYRLVPRLEVVARQPPEGDVL